MEHHDDVYVHCDNGDDTNVHHGPKRVKLSAADDDNLAPTPTPTSTPTPIRDKSFASSLSTVPVVPVFDFYAVEVDFNCAVDPAVLTLAAAAPVTAAAAPILTTSTPAAPISTPAPTFNFYAVEDEDIIAATVDCAAGSNGSNFTGSGSGSITDFNNYNSGTAAFA